MHKKKEITGTSTKFTIFFEPKHECQMRYDALGFELNFGYHNKHDTYNSFSIYIYIYQHIDIYLSVIYVFCCFWKQTL